MICRDRLRIFKKRLRSRKGNSMRTKRKGGGKKDLL
jgi:hypothetical protein